MTKYNQINDEITSSKATLVVVSKNQKIEAIEAIYNQGQRVFAENKVQNLLERKATLPDDIQWHLIGHLQKNKVKYIASFIELIHSVDSLELLDEIDKQAKKNDRIISVLLQVYISNDNTKFGFEPSELLKLTMEDVFKKYTNIKIEGLMGMATFSDNEAQITFEFNVISTLFQQLKANEFFSIDSPILSIGMSGDYKLALACGSTMVRIGSLLFD
jgi:pyridoxal phosphate enzyme (YggS family)